MTDTHYPIGTPGQAWGAAEKAQWLEQQRSYRRHAQDILPRIHALPPLFRVVQYGELDYSALPTGNRYPLLAVHTPAVAGRPTVLITGGVHGYETSGVMGALAFLESEAAHYAAHFNLIVVPCVSPWGYETINRWNPHAIDPNRAFGEAGQAQESQSLKAYLQQLAITPLAHIDLHETTDSDNAEFRPALAARDGVTNKNWNIPDGFYLVDCSSRPTPAFQRAILTRVETVTHIAEPDTDNKLIGSPISQPGVIEYATQKLGLCAGMTQAPYTSTTEVYPDSPNTTPAQCTAAQVAAICGGLDYLLTQNA